MGGPAKRLLILVAIAGILLSQVDGLVGRRESQRSGEVDLKRIKRDAEERELIRAKRGPEEPTLKRVKRLKEEPVLTRVKRLEEEPILTRVKRMEKEPVLTRVKRLEVEPVLTRVKRLEEEPVLTRVKRMEVEPVLTRVKRLEVEPVLTRVKRREDGVELIRVKRDPVERELVRAKRMDQERQLQRAKRPDEEPELTRRKRIKRESKTGSGTAAAGPAAETEAQQAERAEVKPVHDDQEKATPTKADKSQPVEKAAVDLADHDAVVRIDEQSAESRQEADSDHSPEVSNAGPVLSEKEASSPKDPPILSPGQWDTLKPAEGLLDAQAQKPMGASSDPAQLQAQAAERELEEHAALHHRNNFRLRNLPLRKGPDRRGERRRWMESHRGQRRGGAEAQRSKNQLERKQAERAERRGKGQRVRAQGMERTRRGPMLASGVKVQRMATAGRASKRGHGKVWQRLRQRQFLRRQNRAQKKRNHPLHETPKAAAASAPAGHSDTKEAQ